MSIECRFDPSLIGTFRRCSIPGERVTDTYIELERKARALYQLWVASDYRDGDKYAQYQLAQGQCEGFRAAAEIYCPSEPGYSNTSGHLIMAADIALDDAPDEDLQQ